MIAGWRRSWPRCAAMPRWCACACACWTLPSPPPRPPSPWQPRPPPAPGRTALEASRAPATRSRPPTARRSARLRRCGGGYLLYSVQTVQQREWWRGVTTSSLRPPTAQRGARLRGSCEPQEGCGAAEGTTSRALPATWVAPIVQPIVPIAPNGSAHCAA